MNRIFVGTALVVAAFVPLVGCSTYHMGRLEKTLHAKAVITGPGITGEAHLYEEYEGRVRIKVKLDGTPESKLKPGLHAIHIHETGNCEPFAAAKGHYDGNVDTSINPEANVTSGLGNHPYHLGDLQNLSVNDDRKGSLYTITSRVTCPRGSTLCSIRTAVPSSSMSLTISICRTRRPRMRLVGPGSRAA
jgi:Cu-Zn family superoxide dismutase